jgi:hypothetical protein
MWGRGEGRVQKNEKKLKALLKYGFSKHIL